MKIGLLYFVCILLLWNCKGNSDNPSNQTKTPTATKDTLAELQIDIIPSVFPDWLNPMTGEELSNQYSVDTSAILKGDFNGDGAEDFASIIIAKVNNEKGVIIIHQSEPLSYFVFGAGKPVFGLDKLDWIEVFEKIPKGMSIAPTLVDEETGDILGPDFKKEYQLQGDAIQMTVEESSGGGILYWKDNNYEWIHLE